MHPWDVAANCDTKLLSAPLRPSRPSAGTRLWPAGLVLAAVLLMLMAMSEFGSGAQPLFQELYGALGAQVHAAPVAAALSHTGRAAYAGGPHAQPLLRPAQHPRLSSEMHLGATGDAFPQPPLTLYDLPVSNNGARVRCALRGSPVGPSRARGPVGGVGKWGKMQEITPFAPPIPRPPAPDPAVCHASCLSWSRS